ncbi:hypothetical protein C8R41DRAFT_811215 [Lentinula lateritia]|uniref:Uncharacterized protein n=1 Tax=Lentinula lateritia TaxID=40482 RepID=A0ABQ8VVM3_9AGAR|nr:hypothetical protein C8R41DRAFT_811215 [Lentinula lateritia]
MKPVIVLGCWMSDKRIQTTTHNPIPSCPSSASKLSPRSGNHGQEPQIGRILYLERDANR